MRTLNPNTLERVENYITEYQKKNGKSPSYRQIMHGVGMRVLSILCRDTFWRLKERDESKGRESATSPCRRS